MTHTFFLQFSYCKFLTTRKPIMLSRRDGQVLPRYDEQQLDSPLLTVPLRVPRYPSGVDEGPLGSVAVYNLFVKKSKLNSHTLPCVSYRPHLFGNSCPTVCVVIVVLPLHHPKTFN